MNKTLMTDFYELTMAQTYFDNKKQDEKVYFDLFFRKNIYDGGYTISAGVDKMIEYIKNFKFEKRDIEYLRSLNKFSEAFLEYLENLTFTGNMWAIPDGTPVFPNEPIVTIKANLIEAQIIETALLSQFNHSSLITTCAKRVTNAAEGRAVMEFSARRTGFEITTEASKYAYIGGCIGTSNTQAGLEYGLPVTGTMAHSLITEAPSEYEAFLEYAKSNPNNCIFLVDTYDTLKSGIPNAIKVAKEYLIPNGYQFKGIRIDSGDLAYLSKEARKMLDEAGYTDTTICLSNGLDEYTITELIKEGAEFDIIGAGDNIGAPKERVGGVYKLVAVEKDEEIIPKIKISNDTIKTINPGYKKVYRFYDLKTGYALGDIITLHDEIICPDKYTLVHPVDTWKKTELANYRVRELQVPIYKNGVLVYQISTIEETKKYCTEEFKTLYPEVTRLVKPHGYYVDLSVKLLKLKKELLETIREDIENEKVFVK